jgi:hypothetical protein
MLFSFREIKIVCGPDPYLGSLSGQIATRGFTLNGGNSAGFRTGARKSLVAPLGHFTKWSGIFAHALVVLGANVQEMTPPIRCVSALTTN